MANKIYKFQDLEYQQIFDELNILDEESKFRIAIFFNKIYDRQEMALHKTRFPQNPTGFGMVPAFVYPMDIVNKILGKKINKHLLFEYLNTSNILTIARVRHHIRWTQFINKYKFDVWPGEAFLIDIPPYLKPINKLVEKTLDASYV